ncbi:hypothetical protein GCM10010341_52890 [Streptomyces noursei]|nr:hypothetical protein GCM10010341_52890 [Streptomyces noursei]
MPGTSAYEVAVTEGFKGTRPDWLASLIGPADSKARRDRPGPRTSRAPGRTRQAGTPGVDGRVQSINGHSATEVTLPAADVTRREGHPGVEPHTTLVRGVWIAR